MSLNTMLMAETMPAKEILEEFAKLEDGQNATIAQFGNQSTTLTTEGA